MKGVLKHFYLPVYVAYAGVAERSKATPRQAAPGAAEKETKRPVISRVRIPPPALSLYDLRAAESDPHR